jgi:conjugal transfer mating pair stabilization protein TraN
MRVSEDSPGRRALAATLVLALVLEPLPALAQDPMRATGLAAQAEERAYVEAFAPPTVADGVLTLFPGTPAALDVPVAELFPGAAGGDPAAFSGLYGDDAALIGAAAGAGASLPGEASATGEAYRTVIASTDRAHPDLRRDPLWGATDALVRDLPALATGFADCAGERTVVEALARVHVPAYRTCERVERPALSTCTATRALTTATRTASVFLGVRGRDVNTFRFDLTRGRFGLVAPSDGEGPVGSVPALGAGFCAEGAWRLRPLATRDWPWGPEYDPSYGARMITPPTCANGLVGVVQLDDDDRGRRAQRYGAEWPLQYTAITADTWRFSEPGCAELAARVGDGFCRGSVTCTRNAGTPCLAVDGISFCEAELAPPPFAGVNPGCLAVAVAADCRFNVGPLECWTDPAGTVHCPENAGDVATDCAALAQDPACGFIRSTCVEGASGASGACSVYEDTYDCGEDIAVPTLARATRLACAGPVRCLGEDCLLPEAEASADFARAAAALQAAQFLAMDTDCGRRASLSPRRCRVFRGEARGCKRAVGGIVNCCETPDGVSLADYLTLVLAVGKLDSALAGLEPGSPLRGAWETLRSPFTSAWGELSRPFTSLANNLLGTTAPAASEAAAQGAVAVFEQAVLGETARWVGATFGEVAANALFTVEGGPAFVGGALQSGDLALGGFVGTAMSWLMTAYTVYSLAMLLARLLWECEAEEFELGAKRELASCHYLGSYCNRRLLGACLERRQSYCCFNSPLARILQEQLRPQLGMSWGDAEHPLCEGLPLGRLAAVDWERVNLDEWVGILARTGHLPSARSLGLEHLTGTGSALAIEGARANAVERSRARAEGLDAEALRLEAAGELWR